MAAGGPGPASLRRAPPGRREPLASESGVYIKQGLGGDEPVT